MINEYIRYRIPPESTDAFLLAYEAAQESLRASPNCLSYELSRCTEATEYFILRIQWDSQAGHLKGFRTGPRFPLFFKAVQPYLANIEEMRHYELTPICYIREERG